MCNAACIPIFSIDILYRYRLQNSCWTCGAKAGRANMRAGHLFCPGNRDVLHPPCSCEHPLLSALVAGAAGESWGHWAQWSAQGLEPPWGVSFLPPQAQSWDAPWIPHHLLALPGSAILWEAGLTPGLCTRAVNSRTGFQQSRHGQMTIILSNQPELGYTLCQLCAFMPGWRQLGDDRQFLYGTQCKWCREMIPDPAKRLQEQCGLINVF